MDCPKCGAVDSSEAATHCWNCGNPMPVRCSECGAVNHQKVEFCVKCGNRITGPGTARYRLRSRDRSKGPYVVWEGWPFAWLERRMQTRRQFLVWFTLTIVLTAIWIVFFALRLVIVDGLGIGDTACCTSVVIAMFVISTAIYWRVGREGAEEVIREADKED